MTFGFSAVNGIKRKILHSLIKLYVYNYGKLNFSKKFIKYTTIYKTLYKEKRVTERNIQCKYESIGVRSETTQLYDHMMLTRISTRSVSHETLVPTRAIVQE